MRLFYRSEKGAVSVYLILIIVPIFLFQAVLIDYARILIAEKENESAVKAAVRSTLSAFDTNLQAMGLYGLGVTPEEAENIFADVFADNLSGSVSSGAFSFIDHSPDSNESRLTPVYSLASHEVFKHQILEDMKIKAPIEYSLEIAGKFTKNGTAAPFQQGSQFTKEAEEIEKLIEKRNDALDKAWSTSQELHDKITTYHTSYQSRIQELNGLAEKIGIHTVDEVKKNLQNVKEELKSVKDSIEHLEDKLDSLKEAASENQSSIDSIRDSISELKDQAKELKDKQNELEELLELLLKYAALLALTKQEVAVDADTVSSLYQEIEPPLQSAKKTNDELREKLSGVEHQTDASSPANAAFSSVEVYGDDYFHNYQTSVASISALFAAFRGIIESINLYTPDNTSKALQANDAYFNKTNQFYGEQSSLEQKRMQNRDQIEAQKKEQRSKIQEVLNKAKQSIGGCSLTGESGLYEQLQGTKTGDEGFYQKYMEANAQDASIGSEIAYDLEKPDAVSVKAMSMLDMFNNAAGTLRDELYLDEFAITKFNYRTFGLEKDASGQTKASNELVDPSTHSLSGQEVEYLLYGFSSCAANVSSAYAEMFSFRLAIRTLEALLDPKKELLNVGSPFLVLLAAASEGAVKAFEDMNKLVKGEAVELSSKLVPQVLTLNYMDYLRIFLMMHSNNTKLMARMQALIELNTGKDLIHEATYVQGKAVSSIKLWFIPGIMKLLEGSNLLSCNVQGNRCRFSGTAAFSY